MRLGNKVALITGASRGIGEAIALAFAGEGADIIVNYASSTVEAGEVARKVKALGRDSIAVKADVSRRNEVDEMVRAGIQKFGRIDILVNNAGLTRRADFLDITEDDWDTVIDTNLKGTFNCTQAVVRHMVERKSGNIISIASIAGLGNATEKNLVYSVSKGALFTFTKKAANELGKYGIRVNGIAPGLTVTDFTHRGRTEEEFAAFIEKKKQLSMLGAVATTQDIANTALFLASSESSAITGQVIVVDTGTRDFLSHAA
ncbi:MAG: 3-oxoacyl-ACP reductase FabG [Dehalococcoidales bacterium]|nr:3-oxoacyl-ACP reductase FabG [Dehalococcoidales bacterium]